MKDTHVVARGLNSTLGEMTVAVVVVLGIIFLGVFGFLSVVWQFRNPIANPSTVFTHFSDVMHARKLPQFQEPE